VRVTFLTHYFPPELGAAPVRIAALARGLAGEGIEVTVHTGFPHYPAGRIQAPYRNRPWQVERDGDVRIVRSAVYATPNRGTVRRLANHAVLAGSALATARVSGPADVVIAESPPLFTGAAGVGYARAKRAALALNVSDLWPQSAIELGALNGAAVIRTARALEGFCYRHSQAITAPTAGIVATLGAHPAASGRAHHIPPAVDVRRFADADGGPPSRRSGEPLVVLYAGTLGMAQGLDGVLDAAALAGSEVVRLRIAGDGPDRLHLAERIAREGLRHVELLGPVPFQAVAALYADAHAGLVPLRDLQLFRGALPTKLYEVMAAGRPVVVAAHGEAADLVARTASGVVVPPEDPAALAAAWRRLRDDVNAAARMGAAGRQVAALHSREAAISRWSTLLRALDARR
jgi:glycosyltransferase involved in cell wall biosynthesis